MDTHCISQDYTDIKLVHATNSTILYFSDVLILFCAPEKRSIKYSHFFNQGGGGQAYNAFVFVDMLNEYPLGIRLMTHQDKLMNHKFFLRYESAKDVSFVLFSPCLYALLSFYFGQL